MQRIAVMGLGKVGSLVGTLLRESFTVTGVDIQAPHTSLSFSTVRGDIQNEAFLDSFLSTQDAVVSCLPYHANLPVARAAHRAGIHYFDLTEDVATTAAIREMAKTSRGVMAPQLRAGSGFYRHRRGRALQPVYAAAGCRAAGRGVAESS